ncbi:MAG: arsenosugar biosynthesis radical SAM protein ArsS [Pyrinomonadaceae bacterium]|jgi:radical SAM/Cys-rich protein|nr:arsenosugar biosynthesis radical SAM protein ArsS [Pyrinomonadaceae bacterium]
MSTALSVIQGDFGVHSSVAFDEKLAGYGLELHAAAIDTLQVNVGKLCNQACKHCHVDAGPARMEIMTRETAKQIIEAVRKFRIPTVDITGGAPELNPSFRYLVRESRKLASHVIVRHNLTVMFGPGLDDLPEFFREHSVEVASSLPYFLEHETDAQRGHGVFEKSIEALRLLNAVGYGIENSGLILNLVYNPVGAFLPPPQESIEADFKRELWSRYGITFNQLYTITNMPIKRFLDYLRRSGNEERYLRKLVEAFNPNTIDGLMCRNLVSVDWTGRLYDCDFNQMLELGVAPELPQTIADFDPVEFAHRRIMTGAHCFGCTAGAGSSCGGAVAAR